MIKVRGRADLDITPAGWPGVGVFYANAAHVFAVLVGITVPSLREFVGLFCEVRIGLKRIEATFVLPEHLSDEDVEARRRTLVAYLSERAPGVSPLAFEVGTRAPCAAGHSEREECDLCRGACASGGESPSDAAAIPS